MSNIKFENKTIVKERFDKFGNLTRETVITPIKFPASRKSKRILEIKGQIERLMSEHKILESFAESVYVALKQPKRTYKRKHNYLKHPTDVINETANEQTYLNHVKLCIIIIKDELLDLTDEQKKSLVECYKNAILTGLTAYPEIEPKLKELCGDKFIADFISHRSSLRKYLDDKLKNRTE